MPQPMIELGGDSSLPALHFASANGFVPQVYLPLLRPFNDRYHVFSLPPRALWGDQVPPAAGQYVSWQQLAQDLLAALEQVRVQDVVAFGHSIGAVVSLLALLHEPARFRALVLLDPTVLAPAVLQQVLAAREQGIQHPLAEGAARRRRTFASVQEAYERFSARPIFADWDPESLRLYAEHGTVDAGDGTRSLTWSPEWEAHYFSTVYTAIWDDLPRLNALDVPMLWIAGGSSDTFLPESAALVREMLPRATHLTIPGHGHLFPQSAPQQTARLIQAWLEQI